MSFLLKIKRLAAKLYALLPFVYSRVFYLIENKLQSTNIFTMEEYGFRT